MQQSIRQKKILIQELPFEHEAFCPGCRLHVGMSSAYRGYAKKLYNGRIRKLFKKYMNEIKEVATQ